MFLKSPILSKVDASISVVANLHNSEAFLDADPQTRNLGSAKGFSRWPLDLATKINKAIKQLSNEWLL